MKQSLPLLAALAATTLSAPLAAQDLSAFSNLNALAAQMGVASPALALEPRTALRLPDGYAFAAPNGVALEDDVIASLAPRTSIVPLPRLGLSRIVAAETPTNTIVVGDAPHAAIAALDVAPRAVGDMADVLAEASRSAPAGANTAIISNGAGDLVVQSEPARPTLWQRIFGL